MNPGMKRERERVTIVVPARNEEAALAPMLRSLPRATLRAAGFDTEVIVLDGHSTDRTPDVARRYGARVIADRQWGKGCAIRNSIAEFTGDYVVMLDADGTYAADAIPRVLDPLAWGDADVVMGARVVQPGAMTGTHRIGNAILSATASLLYARRTPDVCTGLWGFRAEALRAMPLRSFRFELEAEMFALSARLGMRVTQVPVDYLPRTGSAKLATSDAIRIAWWLLRTRVANIPRTHGNRPGTSPFAPTLRQLVQG